jgi:hypothetical protein
LARVKSLLAVLEREHDLTRADKLGNKLAKKGLTVEPFMPAVDLEPGEGTRILVDTVHQVKGEA